MSEDETDLYELSLRKSDALRTFLVGLGLLLVAAGLGVAFAVIAPALPESDRRVRTGLPGAAITLGLMGLLAGAQGARKWVAARSFAARMRAGEARRSVGSSGAR